MKPRSISRSSFLSPRTAFRRHAMALALLILMRGGIPVAEAQTTERISVATGGGQGNGNSLHDASITPDGRFIAFQSEASNLVAGDGNGVRDIFVRDRLLGTTARVSISSAGAESNGPSIHPSISADGRWVAFAAEATNLVAGDTNGTWDVFLHDRLTGQTTRRSVSSAGAEGNATSDSPVISADGEWLAFASQATTLVALASNAVSHVFLHERATGITSLVATSFAGGLENGSSGWPSLSADGRYIAFSSGSSNLLAVPTAGGLNVFVRDRLAGTTVRASGSLTGGDGNGLSEFPSISASGRSVAFQSSSSNLVAGDTNFLTDVFVRDLDLGVTERVSVSSTGAQSTGGSDATSQPPGISSDGRYVSFTSWATDLVPGALGFVAIYRRDRTQGLTSFVSLSSTGAQALGISQQPSISSDGRFVVFQSQASNLVPGDTNGVSDLFVRGPFATTWCNLGLGLSGTRGVPNLLGSGTLVTGSSGSLSLSSARPASLAVLFFSLSSTPVPFRCGTLVPVPITLQRFLFTQPTGTLPLGWPAFPAGLTGANIYFQYAVVDPAAPCGVALSNALRGDVP